MNKEVWSAQYLSPTRSHFVLWTREEAIQHVETMILNGITNPDGWKLSLALPGRIEFKMEHHGKDWRCIILRLG